jgi:hypothetical protein
MKPEAAVFTAFRHQRRSVEQWRLSGLSRRLSKFVSFENANPSSIMPLTRHTRHPIPWERMAAPHQKQGIQTTLQACEEAGCSETSPTKTCSFSSSSTCLMRSIGVRQKFGVLCVTARLARPRRLFRPRPERPPPSHHPAPCRAARDSPRRPPCFAHIATPPATGSARRRGR